MARNVRCGIEREDERCFYSLVLAVSDYVSQHRGNRGENLPKKMISVCHLCHRQIHYGEKFSYFKRTLFVKTDLTCHLNRFTTPRAKI